MNWPSPEQLAVWDPHVIDSPPPHGAAPPPDREQITVARVRDGLPISDEVLDEILGHDRSAGPPGHYTEAERYDLNRDHDRVEVAERELAEAEEVFGGIAVCWVDGRRGVEVMLTGRLEEFRERLGRALGPDRVSVGRCTATMSEARALQERVRVEAEDLLELGIRVSSHGHSRKGFSIHYWAPDHRRAERILRERFGREPRLSWLGASPHVLRQQPFGSWEAEGNTLHVFYALGRNGEKPADCRALELEDSVIVALQIQDWLGAKTLIGGFIASQATVELKAPLGERSVIDNAENRARPHWTLAAQAGVGHSRCAR